MRKLLLVGVLFAGCENIEVSNPKEATTVEIVEAATDTATIAVIDDELYVLRDGLLVYRAPLRNNRLMTALLVGIIMGMVLVGVIAFIVSR